MIVPDLTEPVTEPVPENGLSTGKILSNKRLEWNLSIPEVAESLNLGTDIIEDLESDNYDRMPGSTFVKGYIRAYARLLKLDVEDLMGHIDLQPERITEVPLSRAALRQKGKTRSRGKKRGGGGRIIKSLLTVIILVALGVYAVSQLQRLGIQSLSDVFKPATERTADGDDPLLIPQSGGGDSANAGQSDDLELAPQSNTDRQREALIRIE